MIWAISLATVRYTSSNTFLIGPKNHAKKTKVGKREREKEMIGAGAVERNN